MRVRAPSVLSLAAVLVAVASLAFAQAGPFVDGDGKPLPFADHDAAMEFLRRARPTAEEPIGAGTTDARRLTLEMNGVRIEAAFRHVETKQANSRVAGRYFREYHDSFAAECAAHDLARLLGIRAVPPTVCRRMYGRDGSLQLWVHGAMTEEIRTASGARPPNGLDWLHRLQEMRLFDNLIYNHDRNRGNMLIDATWRLWLIDHTRAFQHPNELMAADKITIIERGLWQRLRGLERSSVEDVISGYLEPSQVSAVLARRDRIVEHILGLIQLRGEAAVVYEIEE